MSASPQVRGQEEEGQGEDCGSVLELTRLHLLHPSQKELSQSASTQTVMSSPNLSPRIYTTIYFIHSDYILLTICSTRLDWTQFWHILIVNREGDLTPNCTGQILRVPHQLSGCPTVKLSDLLAVLSAV